MQWFKSAMVFSSVVFVAAMAAEGCTSKNPTGGDAGDGGVIKSDAPVKDVAKSDSPTSNCPSSDPACENCDTTSYTPTAQGKPVAHANQCSGTELTAFAAACNLDGAGTQTACTAWQNAEQTSNNTCLTCLFTEQTAANWGFLDCTSTGCSLNRPGCIDVGLNQVSQENSTSSGSCGDLLNAVFGCYDAACATCSATDFQTCETDSQGAECKTYIDAFGNAASCATLNSDAGFPPGVAKCYPASQSGYTDTEFATMAGVFCGGG